MFKNRPVLNEPYQPLDSEFLVSPKEKKESINKLSSFQKIAIPKGRLMILIVEDELRFREAMSYHLSELHNVLVQTAESGYDAINLLRSGEKFDMIFIDIRMPGIDGFDTLKQIRSMGIKSSIVLMSAYAKEMQEQARNLGVRLIAKPDPEDILTQILNQIGGKGCTIKL